MLRKLILENFKSHARTEIPFQAGVTAIAGDNYVGKTSILQALGLVLFNKRPGKQEHFVRHGANSARITLEFTSPLDQRLYRLVRWIGSRSEWKVEDIETGECLEDKSKLVPIWIKQQLQLAPSIELPLLFEESVGVSQGRLTAAFHLTPQQRQQHFDRILGLAQYEEARKILMRNTEKRKGVNAQIKKKIEELNRDIARVEGELSGLPRLQEGFAQCEQELTTQRGRLQSLEAEAASLKKRLSVLEAQREIWQEAQHLHLNVQQALSDVEQQWELARQEYRQAQRAHHIVTQAKEGHTQHETARTHREICQQQRHRLLPSRAQAQRLQTVIATMQGRFDALEEERAQLVQKLEANPGWYEAYHAHQQLEDSLRDYPAWQQGYMQHQQTQQQIADQLQRLQEEFLARQKNLEAAFRHEERLQAKQHNEQKLLQHKASFQKLQSTLAWLTPSKQEANLCPLLQQSCQNCNNDQKRSSLRRASRQQRKEHRRQLASLRSDIHALEAHIASLSEQDPQPQPLAWLQQEQQKAQTQHNTLQQEQQQQEKRTQQYEQERQTWQQRQQALDALLAKAQEHPRDTYFAMKHVTQRLQELTQQQNTLAQSKEQRKSEYATFEAKLMRLNTLEQELAMLDQTLSSTRDDHQRYLTHINIAETCGQKREQQTQLSRQRQVLQQQVTSAAQTLAQSLQRYARQEHEARLEQQQRNHQAQAEVHGQLKWLTQQRQQLQQQQQHLLAQRQQHKELGQQRLHWKQRQQVLQQLRSKMSQAGPQLAHKLRGQLEHQASQFFQQLYDQVGIELKLSESYGLQLVEGEHTRSHDTLAGSEELLASFSVRLALLHLASNLRFAFFDEPTIHLDEEHRIKLAQQLCQLHSVQQLFVISHDESFAHHTDQIVQVFKKQGVSQVQLQA